MSKLGTDWGRSVAVLAFLANASLAAAGARAGAVASDPNLVGSLDFSLWGVQSEGEVWAQFRWSGGASAMTTANATSTRGTILSHPYFLVSVTEMGELLSGTKAWLADHYNDTVYRIPGSQIGMSLTGNDGVTWGPEYEPVVIVSCQYWINAGRGNLHGEMYTPLTVPQIEALAAAINQWLQSPTVTTVPIWAEHVQ